MTALDPISLSLVQNRLGDPLGVFSREEPFLQRRKLNAEDSVGVGNQLLIRTWN